MVSIWRKLGSFLIGVSGLYIIFVSITADFAQVFSLKYGIRLLILLFLTAIFYESYVHVSRFWKKFRVLQSKLKNVRDFIMSCTGHSSSNVLICAQTLWLFQQDNPPIRVSEQLSIEHALLDVSRVSRKPLNLLGVHFTIFDSNNGVSAKGTVIACDSTQACINLYEMTDTFSVGDVAVPLIPPGSSDLERLLGNILFIVSE